MLLIPTDIFWEIVTQNTHTQNIKYPVNTGPIPIHSPSVCACVEQNKFNFETVQLIKIKFKIHFPHVDLTETKQINIQL